jgi:hypothetical protein
MKKIIALVLFTLFVLFGFNTGNLSDRQDSCLRSCDHGVIDIIPYKLDPEDKYIWTCVCGDGTKWNTVAFPFYWEVWWDRIWE